MTRQGWAEKVVAGKATGYNWNGRIRKSTVILPGIAAKLLKAEHARAVRMVKRQLDLFQRQREVEKDEHMRDLLAGSIFACVDLLESLQRGRE